jgi:hypothetical protein
MNLDQTVTTICDSLHDIQAKAAANVADTAQALRTVDLEYAESQRNVQALVISSRRTLKDSVSRIVESSERALKAVYELSDIKLEVSRLSRWTDAMEDSARRSADHKEAEIAARAGASIRELLQRIANRLVCIHDELSQIASTDFAAILETQERLNQVVAALSSRNQELRVTAECTAEQEHSLARKIAAAARALEAEDAARKKLACLAPSQMAEKDIENFVTGRLPDQNQNHLDQWETGFETREPAPAARWWR